jgi:hypothetical protein
MHKRFLRCPVRALLPHHDKTFLYVVALSTPLPDEVSLPARLPIGISPLDDHYVLDGYDIELQWIPPIDHWLGEDLPKMTVANPIRQQPSPGFFVARTLAAAPDSLHGTGPMVCDFGSALEYCRQLGATTGLEVRLPTADEWEMAARGPDGRRFPWGNNAQASGRFGPSPWGIVGAVGRLPQWTTGADSDQVLTCGGKKQWVCAMHQVADKAADIASFRIAIHVP